MTQKDAITRKQETFLLAYLSLPTIQAASASAGVSHDTAQRWLKLPEIQERYQELKQEYVDASLTALLRHTDKAIETLAGHMTNAETPPAQQIRAAQLILEQVIELHKMSDLERRLTEIEALMKGES